MRKEEEEEGSEKKGLRPLPDARRIFLEDNSIVVSSSDSTGNEQKIQTHSQTTTTATARLSFRGRSILLVRVIKLEEGKREREAWLTKTVRHFGVDSGTEKCPEEVG